MNALDVEGLRALHTALSERVCAHDENVLSAAAIGSQRPESVLDDQVRAEFDYFIVVRHVSSALLDDLAAPIGLRGQTEWKCEVHLRNGPLVHVGARPGERRLLAHLVLHEPRTLERASQLFLGNILNETHMCGRPLVEVASASRLTPELLLDDRLGIKDSIRMLRERAVTSLVWQGLSGEPDLIPDRQQVSGVARWLLLAYVARNSWANMRRLQSTPLADRVSALLSQRFGPPPVLPQGSYEDLRHLVVCGAAEHLTEGEFEHSSKIVLDWLAGVGSALQDVG